MHMGYLEKIRLVETCRHMAAKNAFVRVSLQHDLNKTVFGMSFSSKGWQDRHDEVLVREVAARGNFVDGDKMFDGFWKEGGPDYGVNAFGEPFFPSAGKADAVEELEEREAEEEHRSKGAVRERAAALLNSERSRVLHNTQTLFAVFSACSLATVTDAETNATSFLAPPLPPRQTREKAKVGTPVKSPAPRQSDHVAWSGVDHPYSGMMLPSGVIGMPPGHPPPIQVGAAPGTPPQPGGAAAATEELAPPFPNRPWLSKRLQEITARFRASRDYIVREPDYYSVTPFEIKAGKNLLLFALLRGCVNANSEAECKIGLFLIVEEIETNLLPAAAAGGLESDMLKAYVREMRKADAILAANHDLDLAKEALRHLVGEKLARSRLTNTRSRADPGPSAASSRASAATIAKNNGLHALVAAPPRDPAELTNGEMAMSAAMAEYRKKNAKRRQVAAEAGGSAAAAVPAAAPAALAGVKLVMAEVVVLDVLMSTGIPAWPVEGEKAEGVGFDITWEKIMALCREKAKTRLDDAKERLESANRLMREANNENTKVRCERGERCERSERSERSEEGSAPARLLSSSLLLFFLSS